MFIRERRNAPDNTTHNTCLVAVMADYKFFVEHGSNAANAAAVMISFIDFADQVFRSTDFNGYTNLGLDVTKVKYEIKTNDAVHSRYARSFQIIVCTTPDPVACLYSNGSWDVLTLLKKFSQFDWSAYCAAHLFTYQRLLHQDGL